MAVSINWSGTGSSAMVKFSLICFKFGIETSRETDNRFEDSG